MVSFKDLQRVYNKLRIKIMLLMARGILEKVDNTGKTQTMKISCLKNETINKVERLQEFGFESYPPADENTEVLTLFLNGTRDIGIIIKAHNRELRPTDLEEGSSCQWGMDADGGNENRITIKPTKNAIEIKTKDGNIVTIDEDGIVITDVNANSVTMNEDGMIVEDANSNKIEMKSGEINVTGTKVNLLGGTESIIKGTSAQPEMVKDQALMQSLQTAMTTWVPVPNDGGAALKTALAAFLGLAQADYSSILSTTIKGE